METFFVLLVPVFALRAARWRRLKSTMISASGADVADSTGVPAAGRGDAWRGLEPRPGRRAGAALVAHAVCR